MRRTASTVAFAVIGAMASALAVPTSAAPAASSSVSAPSDSAASAPRAAESSRARSITIYVGSGPGGGYDLFARLAARHLGRFLPGNPAVLASNMPGAGSVTAANYLFNSAPADGTALAVLSPSLAMLDVMKAPGVRFAVGQFDWVGRIASIVNVTFTSPTSKVKTIEDARKTEALIAAIDDSSPLTIETRVLDKVAGVRLRLIQGYADSAATQLAVQRGEADGATVSLNALAVAQHDLLAARKLNLLVQYTSMRDPQLPETPTALELAASARDKQIMALYVNSADVGYSLAAPPHLPADRLESLRAGFLAMTKDPQFLADAAKIGAELQPLAGGELQSIVRSVANTPADVLEAAKQAAAH